MDFIPLHFIDEPIEVEFDRPLVFEKSPPCPGRLRWRDALYGIVEMLAEWRSYERRGHVATNMRPAHLATASKRGSWGVGRAYFRVRADTGQVFDLYYDRAPCGAVGRKGSWFLYREMIEV